MIKKILFVFLLVLGSAISADPLSKAIDNLERKPENIARDVYRNPYETISFFQLKPEYEIWLENLHHQLTGQLYLLMKIDLSRFIIPNILIFLQLFFLLR